MTETDTTESDTIEITRWENARLSRDGNGVPLDGEIMLEPHHKSAEDAWAEAERTGRFTTFRRLTQEEFASAYRPRHPRLSELSGLNDASPSTPSARKPST